MLAIFLDVRNEIREITRESEVMRRKIERFKSSEDAEDEDSRIRAIAGCIHGIYSPGVTAMVPSRRSRLV